MTDTIPTDEWYHIEVDSQKESGSGGLITAVAALEDAHPTELPIINDFVDPEALDALFKSRPDGTGRQTDCTIFFTYADYEVRVQSDGIISLSPTSEKQTAD